MKRASPEACAARPRGRRDAHRRDSCAVGARPWARGTMGASDRRDPTPPAQKVAVQNRGPAVPHPTMSTPWPKSVHNVAVQNRECPQCGCPKSRNSWTDGGTRPSATVERPTRAQSIVTPTIASSPPRPNRPPQVSQSWDPRGGVAGPWRQRGGRGQGRSRHPGRTLNPRWT
jgi:hypothetical protein